MTRGLFRLFHEAGDWLRDNWLLTMRRSPLPEDDDDFDFGDEEEGEKELDCA